MPDIDYLMQEWPSEFEGVLSSTHLPTADLDCDLATYVEIICSESPARPVCPADGLLFLFHFRNLLGKLSMHRAEACSM